MHCIPTRPLQIAWSLLVALGCVGVGACDLPTGLPTWDTRWVIPAERTSFAVEDLLPPELSPDASADGFQLELPALSLSASLGEMCSECAPLDGLTLPKPPFTVTLAGEAALPEALVSARLVAGEVELRIRHDFSFDPLRPGGSARGHLILTVRSGSVLLARDSVSGQQLSMPAGRVLERSLDLQPRTIADPIEVGVTLHSPAGDPVTIDLSDRLEIEISAAPVRLTDLSVRLADEEISMPPIELELGEIDRTASERVRSGAIHLSVVNPFEASGDLELDISTAETHIAKPIEIVPGPSTITVELSEEEIRRLVGRDDVLLTIFGPVSTPVEGSAVEPGDELEVGMRLELVVGVGGG